MLMDVRLLVILVFLLAAGSRITSADGEPSGAVDLALKQGQVADRYRQLENLMLKMAEYDAGSNPRRAALLRQAIARGKQQQIGGQLDALVRLLQGEQLQKALEGQTSVQGDLRGLLDLLLSEDRPDRLKSEQARVRDYLKQLDRIIRQQKSLQGRTQSADKPEPLSQDQERVADRTGELGDKIDEAEGLLSSEEQESSGSNSADAQPSGSDAGKSKDAKASDAPERSSDDKEEQSGSPDDTEHPNDAEKESQSTTPSDDSADSPSSGSPASDSQPSDSQPSESQPSGTPSSGSPSDSEAQPNPTPPENSEPSFPGRKRIAAAEDRMREAEEALERAQREAAIDKQEEAKRLLEQAKAELEEILRQLREEEIERVLALLEGRFRRMLEMELKVQDGTQRLSKTPAAKRTRQFSIRVGKLSLDQRRVVLEIDKAITLLREEGSSVAFPEAAEQIRHDMEDVATLLSEENVGSLTQGIEADIVSALEEMIAALQKAQREAEERKNQPAPQGQPQQVSPGDEPLVNRIAELKMIRSLQMRVNTRTQRFSKMLTDVEDPVGQATDEELVKRIKGLSTTQKRIYNVTSDIVLGKNK